MKKILKISISIIIGIVGFVFAMYALFGLVDWVFSDPFNLITDSQVTETYIQPSYRWTQCFDNDSKDFSQEYADKTANEIEKEHPGGSWARRGAQDIIGCTGDLFYQYEIN